MAWTFHGGDPSAWDPDEIQPDIEAARSPSTPVFPENVAMIAHRPAEFRRRLAEGLGNHRLAALFPEREVLRAVLARFRSGADRDLHPHAIDWARTLGLLAEWGDG